jgi:hypothetical protein
MGAQGAVPESLRALSDAEIGRLSADLIGIGGDRRRSIADLVQRSGVATDSKSLAPLALEALPAAAGIQMLDTVPLERARLASKIAAVQSDLARLDAFPRFAPRIAFEHTSDGDERVNLGFQIGLPIFNRNQGQRAGALAAKRESEVSEAFLAGPAFRENLELLRNAAEESAQQCEIYRVKIIPALERAVAAQRREIEAGQGNAIQAWQNLRELDGAGERYLELWIKSLTIRAELGILLGKDL